MSITLPTTPVLLVSRDATGQFLSEHTTLPELIKNSDKGLILYFYPKDSTPGCTVQANDFSADLEKFLEKGYTVVGVSRDGEKSHQNFITRQDLKIALISDKDESLCQHFDVIKEKQMYGKTSLGIVRSTFVFDKTGTLIHELRGVTAKEHSATLLELL